MSDYSIEELRRFCKRKGLIYQSAAIHGGIQGFYDYGPYGTAIKRQLKADWWSSFVEQPDTVIGVDGTTIGSQAVFDASGHLDSFSDLILEAEDGSCQVRADHFLEEELGGDYDGVSAQRVDELVNKHGLTAPNGSEFKPAEPFNLMFETQVGPKQSTANKGYLRPETAQMIFTNFKYAKEHARKRLPFGIAQEGRAYRNEISPRNFIFRGREFEQLEIEHFADPESPGEPPGDADYTTAITLLRQDDQEAGRDGAKRSLKDAQSVESFTPWIAYYAARHVNWLSSLGVNTDNLRLREHLDDELAHYSSACWDLEYRFSFGWKEIMGLADRGQHDLAKHAEASGETLGVYDDERDTHVIPKVACEPSIGVDRAFLTLIADTLYDDGRGNDVLRLAPKVAPNTVAVFPLVNNDEELTAYAETVYDEINQEVDAYWDAKGSIGRRYARQDELGTPYCVTVDFDSLDDDAVTIRFRDSTEQIRVAVDDVADELRERIHQYPDDQGA